MLLDLASTKNWIKFRISELLLELDRKLTLEEFDEAFQEITLELYLINTLLLSFKITGGPNVKDSDR